MSVIDKDTPIKDRSLNKTLRNGLMGKLSVEIKNSDKLFKKFKKSKLHIGKDIYNAGNI